jgi:S1-C subfamily serine protease
VAAVLPSSPAALAGLRPGDLIVRFRGQPIAASAQLRQALASGPINGAEIVFLRNGREISRTLQNRSP